MDVNGKYHLSGQKARSIQKAKPDVPPIAAPGEDEGTEDGAQTVTISKTAQGYSVDDGSGQPQDFPDFHSAMEQVEQVFGESDGDESEEQGTQDASGAPQVGLGGAGASGMGY